MDDMIQFQSVNLSKTLRDAIERQPLDITGRYTRICGCVEYDGGMSLCDYHGGFEDALEAIVDRISPALELLQRSGDGWSARALQARALLEQIKKDSSEQESGKV